MYLQSAQIGRPFTYSLFRCVSQLGTGSGTQCCGPRGGAEVRMKQKSRFKFLPWPGFEPRTLQSDGRDRDHSTTAAKYYAITFLIIPFPLLLLLICMNSCKAPLTVSQQAIQMRDRSVKRKVFKKRRDAGEILWRVLLRIVGRLSFQS